MTICFIFHKQMWVMGSNMTAMNHDSILLNCKIVIPSSINQLSILIDYGDILELLWIILRTLSIVHAPTFRVCHFKRPCNMWFFHFIRFNIMLHFNYFNISLTIVWRNISECNISIITITEKTTLKFKLSGEYIYTSLDHIKFRPEIHIRTQHSFFHLKYSINLKSK